MLLLAFSSFKASIKLERAARQEAKAKSIGQLESQFASLQTRLSDHSNALITELRDMERKIHSYYPVSLAKESPPATTAMSSSATPAVEAPVFSNDSVMLEGNSVIDGRLAQLSVQSHSASKQPTVKDHCNMQSSTPVCSHCGISDHEASECMIRVSIASLLQSTQLR